MKITLETMYRTIVILSLIIIWLLITIIFINQHIRIKEIQDTSDLVKQISQATKEIKEMLLPPNTIEFIK